MHGCLIRQASNRAPYPCLCKGTREHSMEAFGSRRVSLNCALSSGNISRLKLVRPRNMMLAAGLRLTHRPRRELGSIARSGDASRRSGYGTRLLRATRNRMKHRQLALRTPVRPAQNGWRSEQLVSCAASPKASAQPCLHPPAVMLANLALTPSRAFNSLLS
jgi:hypothetical protein